MPSFLSLFHSLSANSNIIKPSYENAQLYCMLPMGIYVWIRNMYVCLRVLRHKVKAWGYIELRD